MVKLSSAFGSISGAELEKLKKQKIKIVTESV
jgi:hypothetical protein